MGWFSNLTMCFLNLWNKHICCMIQCVDATKHQMNPPLSTIRLPKCMCFPSPTFCIYIVYHHLYKHGDINNQYSSNDVKSKEDQQKLTLADGRTLFWYQAFFVWDLHRFMNVVNELDYHRQGMRECNLHHMKLTLLKF